MKHCKKCSHPTICNTHGCAAEEARANKSAAKKLSYEELKAQRDELLAALKLVLGWIDDWCETTGFETIEAQADEAIAKAEGSTA